MKLTWYGHSCFKLETSEGSVVFDPSDNGRVPGYSDLPADFSADEVVCSHDHRDHCAAELVKLSGNGFGGNITLIDSWHDEVKGAKRGANKIALVQAEGMKVVHMGDLGCELDDEQTAALKDVDLLMIPVGGFYTIDSKTARGIADKLNAKIVVPMHYSFEDKGYDVISTVDEFVSISDNVTHYAEGFIEFDKNSAAQTAIIKYVF